ncbi:hypothetical protein [Burkholderia arboris]|uniref:hypothetical protein n=1 Tax=Burkholderia arboris TaxID=488730 RepID=UPI00210997E9|nr:hypothetical protein [Burkholderia arboris]UTV53689.1 hypothetical protein NLX30_12470 [Burkholderia arboris]
MQRSNEAYFRAEKTDVKYYLCVAQSRQIIDKTTSYRGRPESVSRVIPDGAHDRGASAAHHDHAQVNLTGPWNVILLSLSKNAPFLMRVPLRCAAATVETGAFGTPGTGYVVSPL